MPSDNRASFAYLDRKVGPFLDARGVRFVAALDGDELIVAERFYDVISISVHRGDGSGRLDKLYPAFQFGTHGELLPGLREVSCVLWPASKTDTWYLALWLRTRRDAFEGRTPAEILRAGIVAPVLQQAEDDVKEYLVRHGQSEAASEDRKGAQLPE